MIWVIFPDIKKYRELLKNGKLSEITESGLETIIFKQKQIIEFIKKEIRSKNIQYKLLFVKPNIDDDDFSEIKSNDILLWHPNVASSNIFFVKKFEYSIVLLQSKTVFLQKESVLNPITENMAINHSFFIMYLDESYNEVSNSDWSMVVNQDYYLISQKRFREILTNKNK